MSKHPLHKKLSIGISFGQMSVEQIIKILNDYGGYIHDIYFSPVEDLKFQTRRGIYDFKQTSNIERLNELSQVINTAKQNNIKLTITLNTKMANAESMLDQFVFYKNQYNIDFVTTFLPTAILIKEKYPEQQIICSYNEGVTGIEKLNEIIESKLFSYIVLGNHF